MNLLIYLQGIVDETGEPGQFLLTGLHQFELRATTSQSLAARIAILNLLRFLIAKLSKAGITLREALINPGRYFEVQDTRP